MPDVIIKNRRFYNPVDFVFKKLGGTWKIPVLWRLRNNKRRYFTNYWYPMHSMNLFDHANIKAVNLNIPRNSNEGGLFEGLAEKKILEKGTKKIQLNISKLL